MPSQLLLLCFGSTQFDFAAESAASAALQLRAYALGVCVFMEARNVNAHADTPARCFSHAVVIDVNGCGMRKLLTCGSTQEHQPQAYFLLCLTRSPTQHPCCRAQGHVSRKKARLLDLHNCNH